MPIKKETFKKYLNPCLVETGSYTGDGIQDALDAGFERVVSIELSEKFYKRCVERFKNNPNVVIIHGDSADVLYDAIKSISTPITFWLDGHWSDGETAYGKKNSPLMEEFAQIAKHHIKNHTILIDDMRCWVKEDPEIQFGEEDLKKMILSINPTYQFSYEDGHIPNDILVAKP